MILYLLVYKYGPDGSDDAGIPDSVPAATRKIMAKLRSRRPARRCAAAFELGRMKAAEAAPFLVRMLNDEADSMASGERLLQSVIGGDLARPVSSCASTALNQLGPAATTALRAAIDDSDSAIRNRARRLLALSPEPAAVQTMAPLLSSPQFNLRKEALISVAQSGLPSRIEAIRNALKDDDAEVRGLALTYACAERQPWVFDAILAAAHDSDATVRALAMDRLGPRGDARAIDTLIGGLTDRDLGVRQRAHKSLCMITRVDRGTDAAAWREWRKAGTAPASR